ncbi:MAG: hypothetical protein ABIX01_08030 [Chitinophagaceae bacterium]
MRSSFWLFFVVLILACTSVRAQGYTGKWRAQLRASALDIQQDYLLELDLKQEGNKIVGTRTLYLKNYENMVILVEGEVDGNGDLAVRSKNVINYKLPDSTFVVKSFSYSFKKDKYNQDVMAGIFRPQEDESKKSMRMLSPQFYDAVYKVPVQSVFKRLVETFSNTADSIVKAQNPSVKETATLPGTIETLIEHTLTIPEADVTIDLYDNGTIDGDIVTVLINDRVVSQHEKLGIAPISIKIKKEDLAATTTIIMQAENLGDIPPNTALMLITVAGKRYD